ncbi:MAG TPA: PIN domain-containing protein [Candidatus Udaeobacter sp.]|nr:PIN domain-containing protein [Candidatus Udaeobacter sp.]
MPGKAFLDTNVLVYAVTQSDARAARAEELLIAGGVVSVQILNEFAAVARRKLQLPWAEVAEAVVAFLVLCPSPVPITLEIHQAARTIAENLGCNIYDALVLAAALDAGCDVLYSEDFQDGQKIEGKLTVRNPFGRP